MILNGTMQQRRYSRGFKSGTYDAFKLGIIPTWVFVYELYEEDFESGIEFLSVGLPISYTIGEEEGSYSRINVALELDNQWVNHFGLRFQPKIGVDYAYYPEINRDDWGVFAKCQLRY